MGRGDVRFRRRGICLLKSMRTKGVIYVAIIAVLLILGYLWRRKHDAKVDAQVVSVSLLKEDKAKYVIDETRHQLIEITHTNADGAVQQRTVYLPPHASIEVRKDGTFAVTARQWGSEVSPFLGVGVDSEEHGRAVIGVNLFYIQRWELGAGLAIRVRSPLDARVFISGSYNIWSNTSLFVGVDNHKAVAIGVALKF